MDVTSRMLPTEVVTQILQHVPDRQRFNSGALVCRSWHNEAAAATKRLAAQLSQQHQLDSLQEWLQQQGTRLEVLSISSVKSANGSSHNNITLPLEQLRHLRDLRLESLSPAFSHGDFWSRGGCYLSGLTSLQLVDVVLDEPHCYDCAALLTQLTSLRHLQLCNLTARSSHWSVTGNGFSGSEWLEACIQRSLRTSTLLTSLVISSESMMWSRRLIDYVDNLTQLQQLSVSEPNLSAATVNKLPRSLTRLDFRAYFEQLAPSTTPRLMELTCLRHLAIRGGVEVVYDPRLLDSLVQLQYLDLRQCDILEETSVAALLDILPELKQLQHLSLAQSLITHTQAEQYTALVSSNQLTYLDLIDCCMPYNVVQHIFAADCQYPRLETFRIGLCSSKSMGFEAEIRRTVCAGALGHLVSCCPNLRELFIGNTLHPYCVEDLTALEHLTALEKLGITGDAISDASVGALVDLELPALRDLEVNAGLRDLDLEFTDLGFTGEGALYLRKLTQLTRLCIEISGMEGCKVFVDEAGLFDLRKRLADALSDDGDVAKALLREQEKECNEALQRAEEAEQEVQQLRQELQLARQEIESLKITSQCAVQGMPGPK